VSRWATGELRPHVTVLLDLPPEEGLRRAGSPDRLEAEPLDFHERVREQFLQLARRSGARHLVVDATRPADEVAAQIRERLAPMLPLSEQEAVALEEARRAEQEQRRAEAEERAHRQQLEAEERARRQQLEAEERVRREEERRQAEQAREEADRQQRREAAQARQREKAAREAEKAAREAEKARQRATTTEQQRAAQTEQQRAAAAAETARQRATGPHPGGTAPVSPHPRPSGPPRPLTGEVSLLDELLGPPEDDTLQLPQVREDR
jgi:dTMP kinase